MPTIKYISCYLPLSMRAKYSIASIISGLLLGVYAGHSTQVTPSIDISGKGGEVNVISYTIEYTFISWSQDQWP